MNYNPIIVAIDDPNPESAYNIARDLKGSVGHVKLGLEFFTSNGPEWVKKIQALGMPIFLDMKYHDIPNTVAKSVMAATRLKVDMITIHTSGGFEMMRTAAFACQNEALNLGILTPLLLGVTVLTSMSEPELKELGVPSTIEYHVVKLVELGLKAGLSAFVCSPHEIALLKGEFGQDIKLIVPGIRPAGSDATDQKRIMTPKEAIDLGADYLVIGRPILKASNPVQAAKEILATLG